MFDYKNLSLEEYKELMNSGGNYGELCKKRELSNSPVFENMEEFYKAMTETAEEFRNSENYTKFLDSLRNV